MLFWNKIVYLVLKVKYIVDYFLFVSVLFNLVGLIDYLFVMLFIKKELFWFWFKFIVCRLLR